MRALRNRSIRAPLHAVAAKDVNGFLAKYPYLKASGFAAKEGELRLLPGKGGLSAAVLGLGKSTDALALAAFSESLPDGTYRWARCRISAAAPSRAGLAVGLYQFSRYKKPSKRAPKLALPPGVDGEEISRIAGRFSRPRSDQHAAQRHGPGRAGRRRRHPGQTAWRQIPHRHGRGAEKRLSADPCGGAGLGARSRA
jgi:hypothetical protein